MIIPGSTVWPQYHTGAAWFRDGRIAYADLGVICTDADGGSDRDFSLLGIWILDPQTSEKHRVVDGGKNPTWSPDGKRIAFDYGHQIHVLELSDGSVTKLTNEGRNFLPSWSPDGKWIACNRSVGDFGIWLIRPDGTENHKVVVVDDKNLGRGWPAWSLDSKRILHSAFAPLLDLYEMGIDGNFSRPVVIRAGGETDAAYSPDGRSIVFVSQGVPINRNEIWSMRSDGNNQEQLTFCGGLDPSWSPDGSMIVYTKNLQDGSGADGVLWLLDVRNGIEKQLTFQPKCTP